MLNEARDVHKMTFVPPATAARTSWWDISPVKYTSACTPANIDPPEPAQIATVRTGALASLPAGYPTCTVT